MELTHEPLENGALVYFKGRLDAHTAAETQKELLDWMEQGGSRWIYDFSALEYISSAGLRVLLTAVKKARSGGGSIAICGMQASLRDIFEIAGFTALFTEFETLDEAKQSLVA